MSSLITSQKQLWVIYAICVLQFLFVLTLNDKTWILVSAILGILFSGSARRYYQEYQTQQLKEKYEDERTKNN